MRHICFWLLACCCAAGSLWAQTPANLVTNPSFEAVQDGKPVAWGTENWKLGGQMVLDAEVAHTGAHSARVTALSNKERGIWRQIVLLPAAHFLHVSAWYRTNTLRPDPGTGAVIRLIWFSDAERWQEIKLESFGGPPDLQWRLLEKTVAVPEGAKRVGIELFNWDAQGDVWWDDVTVRGATDKETMPFKMEAAKALNRPSGPFEVSRAPYAGQKLTTNPPVFVWLPVPGIKEYLLQYSRDPGFAEAQTTTTTVAGTVQVLRAPLAAGQWYWRVGLNTGSALGAVYGETRPFTIAQEAVLVPFPDTKALAAKLAGRHPRIFVTPDTLPALRELAHTRFKQQVNTMKRSCDSLLGQPLLPEPEFLPEGAEHAPTYVKVFRTTRPYIAGMNACAEVYLLTGENKYGQEARRRLMNIVSWNPEGSTSLMHNDEPGTEIVRVCPRIYDYVYDLLSETEREQCRKCFAIRMPQLYRTLKSKPFEVNPFESHAMGYYLEDLTEACVAMSGDLPVEEWFDYCLKMLWAPFFPPYGGEDGGWCEGPSYWQWSTDVFIRAFNLVQQVTGVPIHQRPWLRNTGYYKLYGNPPHARISPFGDGQAAPASGSQTMWQLALLFDDPYLKWYADMQGYGGPVSLNALLYADRSVTGKPPTDLPQARCFADVGLACLHSDLTNAPNNVSLLLRSSPFGSISHSYADQNAFALEAFGEPLAVASGYYPYYGSPHHAGWSWTTKAANSLGVDGEGQNIRDWNAKGRIAQFVSNQHVHYTRGDAAAAYQGRLRRFDRHVLYIRPLDDTMTPLVVLYDDVQGAKASTYQWWLHALNQMQIDSQQQVVRIVRPGASLVAHFLTPQGLEFTQTDQFPVAPEAPGLPNQWHLTAQTKMAQETCRFLTVLAPLRTGQEEPQVRLLPLAGALAAEIIAQGKRHVVIFRTDLPAGKPLQLGGFKQPGDIVTASWDGAGKLLAVTTIDRSQ